MPIDPRHLSFEEWSTYTARDIANLGFIPVSGVEDDWRDWAYQVVQAPQIAAKGVPDPRGFGTWQEWALRLNEGLLTLGL